MMILQFAIVAQGVAVDRFTNRLSLFNVCERIEAPQFPIIIPELVFVIVLRREPADAAVFDSVLSIRLNETVIGQANLHIDFENSMSARQITNFQGLPVLSPGELQFSFNLANGNSARAAVPVVQTPAAPPQATPRAPAGQ